MYRSAFHIPDGLYFLTHSVGCQSKTYDEMVKSKFVEPWRAATADIWPRWFTALEDFNAGLAPLIGAQANDVCPQTNVSSAVSKILFSLPERPGRRKIVLTEDDFSTVGFALAQAKRMGYELDFLPGGARLADIDTWSAALDDTVHLVLATHIFSNTSVKAPVADIARIARERGIFSILDIAQSTASVPIDLDSWRPDFAVGTSLKYLCGGPGAAFLWANAETAQMCTPMDVGWFSHEDPFEFDIHNFRYADRAMRFFGGTPSIAPFAGASSTHSLLNEIGIEAIEFHNQALLSRLIDAVPKETILSMTVNGSRGSSIILKPKDVDASTHALQSAHVHFDTRSGGLRFSVHIYNSESDIDTLAKLLAPHL